MILSVDTNAQAYTNMNIVVAHSPNFLSFQRDNKSGLKPSIYEGR
jgi:hypothetical protein